MMDDNSCKTLIGVHDEMYGRIKCYLLQQKLEREREEAQRQFLDAMEWAEVSTDIALWYPLPSEGFNMVIV